MTHSNINQKRHLSNSSLHLNGADIFVLVRNFKAFLTNFDWQESENGVNDNSLFLIGDSISPNDVNRMKKQRLDNGNNTIISCLCCGYNKIV